MATPTTLDLHPPLTLRKFNRNLTAGFTRVASTPWMACTIVALLPVVLRLAILPWFPVPLPSVHDEFSYLLGADTFASGRIANPPPPLWQHFESMHIIQQPTYASKYPPLQSLVLAVGMKLGHPWIGVLLSVAVMGACFCWCLQGWLPPIPAFMGALLAAIRFGTCSYWVNSYWGGCVAAIGGALVIGALPRLLRKPQRDTACLFALGLVILANSRPFEGILLAVPVLAVLLFAAGKRRNAGALLWIAAIPMLAVLIPSALLMGYYNYRVTNHWTTMPYQVHERQYAVASAFLFQQPRTPPAYNHPLLREFWAVWDLDAFREAKNHWVKAFLNHAEMGLGFLAGALVLGIGLILLPFPPWNSVDRLTWPILAVFFLGMLPMKGVQSHYFAPIAALAFIRFMNGSATLWKWRPDARPIGPVMAMFAFEFVLLQSFVLLPTPPSVAAFGRNRASVEALLTAKPGKQLVIVRYQPNHFVHEEWVYNRADIDASQIVWARDMGADKDNKLVSYFKDRTTWLFEPDKDSSTLVPYSTAASVSPPGH